MEDFSALAPALGLPVEPTFGDFLDPDKAEDMIMNGDHTVAIVKRLKKEPDGLERFELGDPYGKRRDLERRCHELSIVLRERHGYTVNDELLSETIWNLRKAYFMGSELTARYFRSANPVFVEDGSGELYLVVAPKLIDLE